MHIAATTALEVRQSIYNNISCNDMQGGDCGLVFSGYCFPSVIGENTLALHDLGLVLVTNITASLGITGPQEHMGNNITNCASLNDQDAVNYNDHDVIIQSQFTVSPTSPYLPDNINNLVAIQAFLPPISGQEYSCQSNNICPLGIGSRSKSLEENDKLSIELIYSKLGVSVFEDARTWSARKNTLEWIKSQQIKTDKAELWLKSFQNSSLELYSNIGVFCNNYSPQSANLKSLLLQYKSSQLYSKKALITNDQPMLKELIKAELNKINMQKERKIYMFVSALLDENPETIYEENQKQVSLIRLHQLLNPIGFTNNEMDILTNIAYKCPYEEGNGVYEARMLLRSTKPVVAKEEDLCGSRENYHLDGKVQIKNMLVYPNPSNENIHITLKGTKGNEIYSGKLMELSGRVVKEFSISNFYDLSTFTFEPGMYILSINHNPQWTTKVFIQK